MERSRPKDTKKRSGRRSADRVQNDNADPEGVDAVKSGLTVDAVETEEAVTSSTTTTAVEDEEAESAKAEGQSKAMSVTVQDIEGDGSLVSNGAQSMDERLRRLRRPRQWMANKGGAEPAEPTATGSTATDTLKSAASTLKAAVKGMVSDHEDMDIDSSSDDEPMATNQTATEPVLWRIVLPPPYDQQVAARPQ